MATPSHGSYLTPAGQVMPAYSGRGRPPLNPQYNAMVNAYSSHYPILFRSFFLMLTKKSFFGL